MGTLHFFKYKTYIFQNNNDAFIFPIKYKFELNFWNEINYV